MGYIDSQDKYDHFKKLWDATFRIPLMKDPHAKLMNGRDLPIYFVAPTGFDSSGTYDRVDDFKCHFRSGGIENIPWERIEKIYDANPPKEPFDFSKVKTIFT